jgi:glycosyltransferase involved in cell wall biosynthesis
VKVAYVTPRYGSEVLGGAEYAARMLAERLVSQLGWQVEVFTSCAIDSATWEPWYEPTTADVNGVQVHRFANEPRHPKFQRLSDRLLPRPQLATVEDTELWIDRQGPKSPDLLDALAQSDADVIAFYPYLYYPTVRGLPLVRERAVLHPAAHDEAPLRLPLFAQLFSQTRGFVFQTDGERRLVEQLFHVADTPQLSLGLGVDPQTGDPKGFRTEFGLDDTPFALCLGRVDSGKGSTLLATYFAEYKRRFPGPLKLVFAGPIVDELDMHDDIIVTGPISDEHKWGALGETEVLISPSAFEAFSLVLIEAWSVETPVLVNGSCIATREHVERSSGGLWFDGYLSFEAALSRMLDDAQLASAMATNGNRYVDARFRWPVLIERYGAFLERMAPKTSSWT